MTLVEFVVQFVLVFSMFAWLVWTRETMKGLKEDLADVETRLYIMELED